MKKVSLGHVHGYVHAGMYMHAAVATSGRRPHPRLWTRTWHRRGVEGACAAWRHDLRTSWGGGQERTHQVRHCSPEKRRKPAFNSHRATGGRVPHTLALEARSGNTFEQKRHGCEHRPPSQAANQGKALTATPRAWVRPRAGGGTHRCAEAIWAGRWPRGLRVCCLFGASWGGGGGRLGVRHVHKSIWRHQ